VQRRRHAVLAALAIAGCAGPAVQSPPAPAPAPTGARVGIHGMVVVGRAQHYFEHIPMFRPPHDQQLVLRVALRDRAGVALDTDFGARTYTFEPAQPTSLDDLAHAGRTLVGDIHRGSFERGGELAIAGVTATVEAVVLSRPLPGTAAHGAYVFGAGGDTYATGAIAPNRAFQQIVRVTGAAAAPDVARPVDVADGRLAPGAALGDGVVAAELWCVAGPDFYDPCSGT
jgi:hypothetical protein